MSDFASQNLTIGQVNAIVKMLGGEEGAKCFLRGETVIKAVVPAELKVFKTLKLGIGTKDADGYRKDIKDKKMRIGDYANNILGKPQFTVANEETELDLVIVSVAELGFKNGAKLKDIFARAKEKGLQLCPNQVGPELRLQYEDQPKDEWLIIGMNPITDSSGNLGLFYVSHDARGLWLCTYYDGFDDVWDGYGRFVFVLSCK